MKKVIGIYSGTLFFPPERMHQWDEKNLEIGGIGGCEIWAIEIARQFEQNGYHCIVFADCNTWHYDEYGVEFTPYNRLDYVCRNQHFDIFIASRRTDIISENIDADRIYLMAHDPFILWCDTYQDLKLDKVYKIAYQSDFQKRLLKEKYSGLNDDVFFKTFQAINPLLYNQTGIIKKNKMLWSSHKIRGARILIEKIFPLIREEIPDFEIDVCGYVNDVDDEYFKREGINILGNVSKSEMIKRQLESKIWIYPNWGKFEDGRINDETFCITAIENALAKNALIVADRTCFSTTLKGYKGFVGTELFGENDILSEDKIDEFARIMASKAIEYLKDEELRNNMAENAYGISCNYTWENACKTFIEEFDKPIVKMNSEKVDLILMTGSYRISNLNTVMDSIIDNFKDKNIGITWLICHDIQHANGDIVPIVERCKEINQKYPWFGWMYYPVDNNNESNFGGALYNEAIMYVKSQYYPDTNPWVYILDDDNVINPLMAETIRGAILSAESQNKELLYYNMMYENGICAPLCHTSFVPETVRSGGFIPYYLVTDPSQIVINYKMIEDMDFYKPYLTYDEDIFVYINNHLDKVCFPEEWGEEQYLNRYQTTHNALVSLEDKNKWRDILKDNNKAKSCAFSICTNKDGNKIFYISEDEAKEIFDKYILNK